MIEEGGHTRQRRFALVLDVDGELDFNLANAAEVGNAIKFRAQTNALTALDSLAETHLVHTIVDQHLDIVYLDNLFPEIRQEGERQIAVSDGRTEGTFLRALLVHVNPLVVQRGVGEKVDAVLVHLQPIRLSEGLT